MNQDFPFDRVILGTLAIAYGEIVPHSPRFRLTGEDASFDTADGGRLNFRMAVRQSAAFELFGDRRELAGDGLCSAGLYAGNTLFRSFVCFVSTTYDDKNHLTSVVLTASETL